MWNEHAIARGVAQQQLARKCVVLVPNCNWTGHECDVLLCDSDGPHFVRVSSVRRAMPCKDAEKLTPTQALDVARLANLRMWDAYHQRDNMAARAKA